MVFWYWFWIAALLALTPQYNSHCVRKDSTFILSPVNASGSLPRNFVSGARLCGGNRPGPAGAGNPSPPPPLPPLPPPPPPPPPPPSPLSGRRIGGCGGGWNGCRFSFPGNWNCQRGMSVFRCSSGGSAWSEPSARRMFSAVSSSTFMACPMTRLIRM
jgi:hypothetical protein